MSEALLKTDVPLHIMDLLRSPCQAKDVALELLDLIVAAQF